MCAWPKRFFIVPASTLKPAVCAVIHLNAIILKKRPIKKAISRKWCQEKLIKIGVIYMDNDC